MLKLAYTVATPDVEDTKILALTGNLETNLANLAQYGYQGVELMVRKVSTLDAARLRAQCRDLNLEIAAVSSGQLTFEDGLILSAPDETLRKKSVRATQEVVDFTRAVGAKLVNIGTLRGQLPAKPPEREAAQSAMVKSMHEVLDYARAQDITIAFEPQCRYVGNWHNSTHETYAWMQQFSSPNFRLLFDVYHSMVEDLSLSASLIRYAPHVAHVQVSDSNRRAPGSGQWNFPNVIRLLKAVGYQGFVSVEVVQQPSGLEAARRAAAHLLPLLNEEEV